MISTSENFAVKPFGKYAYSKNKITIKKNCYYLRIDLDIVRKFIILKSIRIRLSFRLIKHFIKVLTQWARMEKLRYEL